MSKENEVLILGGGISGLSAAWYLKKAGIPFLLFEKEQETGGSIQTKIKDSSVFDFGPNTLRDTTGEIREMADELGLKEDILEISEAFKTRYIVRYGEMQALEPSLGSLISTKILSGKGKLRILAEPFISKGPTEDESVGEFLSRRVGSEAADYLADPVFSGIYAGDIYRMSKKEILGKLSENEQEFGSIIWGAIRSKKKKEEESEAVKPMVLSFREGIQQLTNAITEKLDNHIKYENVKSLIKTEEGFEVKTTEGSYKTKTVISCIPSFTLSSILTGFEAELSENLNKIDYPPMISAHLLFDKEVFPEDKKGFGFLIPRKESIRLLGAIWKTSLFPELTKDGKFQFTLMAGGAHDRQVVNKPLEKIEQEIVSEFQHIMGISGKPEMVISKVWEKAIPQYTVGYQNIRDQIQKTEEKNPGLHIGGNFRWGISVPDCIAGAKKTVNSL